MANICINKEDAAKIRALIDNGSISIDDLKGMSSKDRSDFFSKYTSEDIASRLNRGFEERINSKTKNILENYIDRELTKTSRKVKDTLSEKLIKIGNYLDPQQGDAFLDELVAHKIGAHIEPETAERVLKFAEKAQELKAKISDTDTVIKFGARGNVKPVAGKSMADLQKIADERLAFGRADFDVKNYMENVVREKAKGVPSPDGVIPKGNYYTGKALKEAGSVTKAIKATLDNSVFGRQGWKMMMMNPKQWGDNFIKSWVDIGKSFGDLKENRRLIDTKGEPTEFFYENVMRETHADIVSRPNALRGAYRMASNEFGLDVSAEELFPHLFDYSAGSKKEKIFGNIAVNIPVRAHKGFENAFSAGALRMRADLADSVIAQVERTGHSAMNKEIANALGTFVSSVTGRGELGRLSAVGNELGTLFFSPRFLKSQIDTVLQPYQLATHTGAFANIPKEVRAVIGKKYATYLGSNATLLTVLSLAGLTSLDPRNDAFGYLVVGDRKYDITGGTRGIFVLSAKLASTKRINFTTGAVTDKADSYGYDKLDEIVNFFEGKTSPMTSTALKLFLKDGINFDGYDINPLHGINATKNLASDLLVPITLNQWASMAEYNEPSMVAGMMAEFLGVGNRVQVNRPGYGKWSELLNSNEAQYQNAVAEYNTEMWNLVRKNQNSVKVKRMSKEEMSEYYVKELDVMKRGILKKYDKYIDKEEAK